MADIAEKNRAREALEKALSNVIKAFLLYSPFVSDKDRGEMRLPIHDTKPTSMLPARDLPGIRHRHVCSKQAVRAFLGRGY